MMNHRPEDACCQPPQVVVSAAPASRLAIIFDRAGRSARPVCRITAGIVAGWVTVALLSAIQAQMLAAFHGRPQPWWPSLGYSLAIFSIWAMLTPIMLNAIGQIGRSATRTRQAALHSVGLLGFTALHLALFVILYWPVYGGAAASPMAMARPVFLANVDKAVFAYAAMVLVEHFLRRTRPSDPVHADELKPKPETGLWIRNGGKRQFVAYEEIDWIGAAGDYAEVHASGSAILADRSLTELSEVLPRDAFARIHRSTIVRLDRVRHIQGVGRGDADLSLASGDILRLSRRYRENLMDTIGRP